MRSRLQKMFPFCLYCVEMQIPLHLVQILRDLLCFANFTGLKLSERVKINGNHPTFAIFTFVNGTEGQDVELNVLKKYLQLSLKIQSIKKNYPQTSLLSGYEIFRNLTRNCTINTKNFYKTYLNTYVIFV